MPLVPAEPTTVPNPTIVPTATTVPTEPNPTTVPTEVPMATVVPPEKFIQGYGDEDQDEWLATNPQKEQYGPSKQERNF
jgi:hypothetical protein